MIDEEELIQENIQNLDAADIPIVSYFGSGSSLLGSILIKLGMDYIEGYQERVMPGEKQTEIANPFWRNHWQILDQKYNDNKNRNLRFFKAHHYPVSFEKSRVTKAILLVRDARDATLSYYNWRVGFLNDKRTFDEFLKTDSYFQRKPFEDWALFCDDWTEWGKSHDLHVLTFEDLKFNCFETVKKLLDFVGICCPDEDIRIAIKTTSFQAMRKQEDENSAKDQPSRIFRKGLIGEWRDVYTPEQLALITPEARRWLEEFGYSVLDAKTPGFDVTVITSEKNKQAVEQLLQPKSGLTSKILTGPFTPHDLEANMGKTTINQSDHFEIIRSIDLVCRLKKLEHVIVADDDVGFRELQRYIAMA